MQFSKPPEPLNAGAAIRVARGVGILMIIQLLVAVLVNSFLEAPLFDAPGFLVNASSHPQELGLAVILAMITEGLYLAIAVAAFPLFYQCSRTLALWLFALAAVVLALAVAENGAVMSMISLSQAYAKAGAAEREQLETIRIVVGSARNWPHFLARMFDGCTIFVLYAALYRCGLIPRLLAGLGLFTVLLQVTGVAMPLFGYGVVFPMLAPLALSLLIIALWLIAKGFRGRNRPTAQHSMKTQFLLLVASTTGLVQATIGFTGAATLEQQTRSFTISLNGYVTEVTPLFGPIREAEWAPSWKPHFIHPTDGEQREGAVFTTKSANGMERLWLLTAYDVDQGRVEYVFMTPGFTANEIKIRVVPDGDRRSKATITYRHSALASEGNQEVAKLDAHWAEQQRAHWESAINSALAKGSAHD